VLSSKRAILFVLAKCCLQLVSQSFDEHLEALLLLRRRVISLILISLISDFGFSPIFGDSDGRRRRKCRGRRDGRNRFCVWGGGFPVDFLFTRFISRIHSVWR